MALPLIMGYLTFDAWLSYKLNDYTLQMHDATVDFFIAENKLNLTPHCLYSIKGYYATCMILADLAKDHGDDVSYLQAIRKNYYCMLSQMKGISNDKNRMQVYRYARRCLKLVCNHYMLNDNQQKARHLRSQFVVEMFK